MTPSSSHQPLAILDTDKSDIQEPSTQNRKTGRSRSYTTSSTVLDDLTIKQQLDKIEKALEQNPKIFGPSVNFGKNCSGQFKSKKSLIS